RCRLARPHRLHRPRRRYGRAARPASRAASRLAGHPTGKEEHPMSASPDNTEHEPTGARRPEASAGDTDREYRRALETAGRLLGQPLTLPLADRQPAGGEDLPRLAHG